jgi:hypothetical protein
MVLSNRDWREFHNLKSRHSRIHWRKTRPKRAPLINFVQARHIQARHIYGIAELTAEITVDTRWNAGRAQIDAAFRPFGKNAGWICWIVSLAAEITVDDAFINHYFDYRRREHAGSSPSSSQLRSVSPGQRAVIGQSRLPWASTS